MWKLPLFDTDFGQEELTAVQAPLKEGWLTMGPYTERLERAFAKLVGAKHAIALTNCTAALHLALDAIGIGPGDEVIVPSMTFVATVNAVRYCGGTVVFADIASDADPTLDPDDVVRKITSRTRAIVPMHYAGFPAAVERLNEIAANCEAFIVEDSAHALVTSLKGNALGTWGRAGCFSFFSNKNMTCGEGGMLVTDNDDVADSARLRRSHGMTTLTMDRHRGRAWSYDCIEVGWNYRIDEIRASLALTQLERLPTFLSQRRQVRRWYIENLESLPITIPFLHLDQRLAEDLEVGPHIMPIALPSGVDRQRIMEALAKDGIQSSVHYPPAHLFSVSTREGHSPLSRTEDFGSRELTLPFFPKMSQVEVKMVCDALRKALHLRS